MLGGLGFDDKLLRNKQDSHKPSVLSELLCCKCHREGKVQMVSHGWVVMGCLNCGIAVAAYKSFENAEALWIKFNAT